MIIRNIVIENFRAVEHLEVTLSDGMNVLIGDNGAGKSSVLDAVSILYSWLPALVKNRQGKGRQIAERDVRKGAGWCYLEIEVEHEGHRVAWSLLKALGGEPGAGGRRTDLQQLRAFTSELRRDSDVMTGLVTTYGIDRNVTTPAVDKRLYDKKGKKVAAGNTATFSWRGFFNWYYERENEENRMKARFNAQYHDETLDAVRLSMATVFPGFNNLRVEDTPTTHFVIDKQGQTIDFNALSDGEKSYITLILDITRRVSAGSDRIMGCGQVMLIDEVDLHLHPSWQLLVVSNLRRMFPNIQFLVTSHSPLVLSSLNEDDRLVVLKDGREQTISDIPYGDNGDYILKRFFGLDAVRNPEVQKEIDGLASELAKPMPDLAKVEQGLNRLTTAGVNFDEAVKMRLMLAQKRKAHEKA